MRLPFVTVVLPFRNAERFLAGAIESILSQDYADYELILIEDGSTDGSAQLAARYISDNVTLAAQHHGGVGAAFARGIDLARGQIIVCASADDLSHKDRLRRSVQKLGDETAEIVTCRPNIIDGDGNARDPSHFPAFERRVDVGDRRALFASLFYEQNFLCAPSAAINAESVKRLGVNAGLMQLQDFDFWMRAAAEGMRFHIEDSAWLDYRWHDDNISKNANWGRSNKETPLIYRRLAGSLDAVQLRDLLATRTPDFIDPEHLATAPAEILRPFAFIVHENNDVKQIGYDMMIDMLRNADTAMHLRTSTGMTSADIDHILGR